MVCKNDKLYLWIEYACTRYNCDQCDQVRLSLMVIGNKYS